MKTKKVLLSTVCSALATLAIAFTSPASAISWADSNGQWCFDACKAKGRLAIASATFNAPGNPANGAHVYICVADVGGQGHRAGYNIKPGWGKTCGVGFGGKETYVKKFKCLCN